MLLFSLVYASTAVYSLRPVIKLSPALVNDVDPRDGSTPLHAAGKIIPNFSLTQHTQSESVTIFITLSSVLTRSILSPSQASSSILDALVTAGIHPDAQNKSLQTAKDIAVATGNLPAMLCLQKHAERVQAESNLALLR
jgi:hypothetical protein